MDAAETTGDNRRERRRCAILAAARKLFLADGYERTTLGDILAISGGSRSTLMGIFGGKEGLFAAMLEDVSRDVAATFKALDASDDPPDTALRAFAHQFLVAILRPETVAQIRVLAAEAGRFPELGRAFFRVGPETGDAMLAAYLKRSIDAGHLLPGDPAAMSQSFLGMIVGGLETRAILGIDTVETIEEHRARVDAAVNIFLHGAAQK